MFIEEGTHPLDRCNWPAEWIERESLGGHTQEELDKGLEDDDSLYEYLFGPKFASKKTACLDVDLTYADHE